MGRKIVPISLPQPAITCLLKIKKRNHHIQFKKIITYKIKWLNEHTMKCWARLSTNCCTSFWQSWLCMCVSKNSSIGLGSRSRDVACKKKKWKCLNIFINKNKLINNIFHLNYSYHSLCMYTEQNGADGVHGHRIMNLPVLVVGTGLWASCEPLRPHMLNILRPYIPRDVWRFEIPLNRHVIPTLDTVISRVFFDFFVFHTKNHGTYFHSEKLDFKT